MRKRIKIAAGIIGAGLALTVLAVLVLPKHQGTPYLRAFAKNEFGLEGDLVNWDSREPTRKHVLEYRSGADYGIEYPARSYFFLDGQYYLEDAEHGFTPVSDPPERLAQTAEMFDRASVLSNYDFSGAEFLSGSSGELPDPRTGEAVRCDQEDYYLPREGCVVRLSFRSGSLYAIQSRYLSSVFYVSGFSKEAGAVDPGAASPGP